MARDAQLFLKRLPLSIVVTAACLGLAVGAMGAGMAERLEAQGRGSDALAWRSSSPVALALEAQALATESDLAAAGNKARRALRASPLQANALWVLALEADAARLPEAQALMERAARLDPRDGDTQSWLMERALLRGDYGEALRRADDLMRRSVDARAALFYFILPLLRDPGARDALATRLALTPPWRPGLLRMVSRGADVDDMAELLLSMKKTSAPATDDEAAPVFQRMIASRYYESAKSYWDQLIVGASSNPRPLIYDGGFDGLAGPPPMNWQALRVAGGAAGWKTPTGGSTGILTVSHDGFRSSAPLVRQIVFLEPGRYEMRARARAQDPSASDRFQLELICATGVRLGSLLLKARPGQWLDSQKVFEVPAEGCDAQWLRVSPVMVDRSEVVEVEIDDISVKPAAYAASPLDGERP